jgi:phage gpG-like protein
MTRVAMEWYGDQFLARVTAAAEGALDTTASALEGEVIRTLAKTTATAESRRGKRLRFRASMPGTPPGSRTGHLRNSITWNRSGDLKRRVGTNLEYARIHELGGTIQHPGGTHYIMTSGGAAFLSDEKALRLKQQGYWVGSTRPHAITMPKRPYLVPTLARMSGSGKLQRAFNAAMKRNLRARGAA